jgi:hypothetical protein
MMIDKHAEAAKHFMQDEKIALELTSAEAAIFIYHDAFRIGSIRMLDKDIVLCAHTSFTIPEDFVDAILDIDPKRKVLRIDSSLELAARQDIMAIDGNRLVKMSPEQTDRAKSIVDGREIIELKFKQ